MQRGGGAAYKLAEAQTGRSKQHATRHFMNMEVCLGRVDVTLPPDILDPLHAKDVDILECEWALGFIRNHPNATRQVAAYLMGNSFEAEGRRLFHTPEHTYNYLLQKKYRSEAPSGQLILPANVLGLFTRPSTSAPGTFHGGANAVTADS